MTEPVFDIIFRGDIVPGHSIRDVKVRLSQLFKVDAAKVEALFAGGVVPLKRNVDKATAEKYQAVLTRAGAQVRIRPAGGAGKAPASGRSARPGSDEPPRPAAAPEPASGADFGGDFSLAPAGANLLNPSETRQVPPRELDLSAISLKPMEGDLLDASEKAKPVSADIPLQDYGVAPPGADLLEGFHHEPLPLPDMAPDFDLAEPGADLLDPAERPRREAVRVNIDHLAVLPPGE